MEIIAAHSWATATLSGSFMRTGVLCRTGVPPIRPHDRTKQNKNSHHEPLSERADFERASERADFESDLLLPADRSVVVDPITPPPPPPHPPLNKFVVAVWWGTYNRGWRAQRNGQV